MRFSTCVFVVAAGADYQPSYRVTLQDSFFGPSETVSVGEFRFVSFSLFGFNLRVLCSYKVSRVQVK